MKNKGERAKEGMKDKGKRRGNEAGREEEEEEEQEEICEKTEIFLVWIQRSFKTAVTLLFIQQTTLTQWINWRNLLHFGPRRSSKSLLKVNRYSNENTGYFTTEADKITLNTLGIDLFAAKVM